MYSATLIVIFLFETTFGCAQSSRLRTRFQSSGDSMDRFLFTAIHIDSATHSQVFLLSQDSVYITTLLDTIMAHSNFVIFVLIGLFKQAQRKFPGKEIIELPKLKSDQLYRFRFTAKHQIFKEKFLFFN